MSAWLRKMTALTLAGALIGVSPGPSAAQEFAAAARGIPALPPAAVGAAGFAPISAAPSLTLAPAPGLGAALTVPSLSPAALAVPAAPLLAARAAATLPSAAPAPASAATLVAAPASRGAVAAAASAGGLSRLVSAAASALQFIQPSAASASIKDDAGRDFDQSAARASRPADPLSYEAFEAAASRGGLGKAELRGVVGKPAGPPSVPGAPKIQRRLYHWLGIAVVAVAVIAHPRLAAAALARAAVPSYYFANGAGSLFPFIQVHEIFKKRSADVSSTTLLTGFAASLLLAVNFSYMGVAFAAMQNLAGTLSFGVIAAQKFWYARHPASADAAPAGKAATFAKTAAAVAVVGGLTFALGKGMLAALPAVAAVGSLLVPFQVLSGLGFAYLMLPEYLKIKRNKSVGDSSRGMALTYWACIIASGLWGLNKLVTMPTSVSAANILPLLAFVGAAIPANLAIVRWTASRPWKFIPEKVQIGRWSLSRENLVNIASFLVLAPFMLAVVGLGALLFGHILPIAAGSLHQFTAYLLYLVSNILAMVVTSETLRAFKAHAPKKDSPKP